MIGAISFTGNRPTASELTTTAGRVFLISAPTVGSKLTIQISPRFGETGQNHIKKGFSARLLVDPFAGGGSIPMEALRLGCDTIASLENHPWIIYEELAPISEELCSVF